MASTMLEAYVGSIEVLILLVSRFIHITFAKNIGHTSSIRYVYGLHGNEGKYTFPDQSVTTGFVVDERFLNTSKVGKYYNY